MRIIIDTNIFIPLEDINTSFNADLAKLSRLVSGHHELLIHPASKDDIARDKNNKRKQSMLLRTEKYNLLEKPPAFNTGQETKMFGLPKKANDSADNLILLAILKNCAHFLVTEDSGLLRKAQLKGVGDRVLKIKQLCELLNGDQTRLSSDLVKIKDVPCHSLDVNNNIFNSLRVGYTGFNTWFENIARAGRKAWLCGEVDDIHAICIYKEEENEPITNEGIKLEGRLLKLCTFKVSKNGYKLGELLIKQAFDYADINNIKGVYLTINESQSDLKFLKDLVGDFGFEYIGVDTKGRDSVFMKTFITLDSISTSELSLSHLEFLIKYYPAINANSINAYLIPVQPQFHNRLFPDICPQHTLFSFDEDSVGNAIKQAYICRAQTKSMNSGDIVFFYRTHDAKWITTYGVVEQFLIKNNSDEIFNIVKNRTVYNIGDITKMNSDLKAKVILFRRIRHLKKMIGFDRLKEINIVSGAIQSVVKLDHNQLKLLIDEAEINDCFLPD